MFYKSFSILSVTRIGVLGVAVFSGSAMAQFQNAFSSSGTTQPQASVPLNPGLPLCPPQIAGQPEPRAPDGQPWTPGINCTLQPETAQTLDGNGTSQAAGQPFNTVDTSLVSDTAGQTDSGVYLNNSTSDTTGQYDNVNQYGDVNQSLQNALDHFDGRVGMSFNTNPDYLGADMGGLNPSLLLDLTFGAEGSLNNADGLGWRIIGLGDIGGKLSLNWKGAQTFQGPTEELSANSDQMHIEADLTVTSDQGIGYELEFSRALSGLDGWTLTAALTADIPMDTGVLKGHVGITHASIDWMESYYGISEAESTASGLPKYSPSAGLRDLFAEVSIEVPFNANTGMDLRAGVRRATGPVANSPQVANLGSANDYTGGVGFYYRF